MSKYDCDIFIIGAGPSGIAAAVYGSNAGLNVVINEKALIGGQVAQSFEIRNYLGFEVISGGQLAEKFEGQLKKSSAKLEEFNEIESVYLSDSLKEIATEKDIFHAKAVIISTGAEPRRLPIVEEKAYYGKGIHYCALCDGSAYKNKTVTVTGSGNGALEEALYLSGIAKKVVLLCRSGAFHGEKSLIKRVEKAKNIEVFYNENIISAGGEKMLGYVETENKVNGKKSRFQTEGLFVSIGRKPNTELFANRIDLDESGYIKTDSKLMTNIKGVFAAGDVRVKDWRQIATAVADGATAALEAEKFIRSEMEC